MLSRREEAVSLAFHKGVLLPDPAGLLRGSGRYVHADATAQLSALRQLLAEALARGTDMLA